MRRGACNTISVYENPSGQRIGGGPVVDWKKAKTEYITKGISLRKLAEKYGAAESTVFARAKKEQWVEQREQYQRKTVAKTIEAAATKEVDRATRLKTVADKLLDKVEELMETGSPMMLNSQSLKHLSGVIKDIKDIHMIKSEADLREQEARIKRLEMETDPNRGAESPKLIIEGLPEEFKA